MADPSMTSRGPKSRARNFKLTHYRIPAAVITVLTARLKDSTAAVAQLQVELKEAREQRWVVERSITYFEERKAENGDVYHYACNEIRPMRKHGKPGDGHGNVVE